MRCLTAEGFHIGIIRVKVFFGFEKDKQELSITVDVREAVII